MAEKIVYKEESFAIIGACMEVHKYFGNGFLEPVYQESLEIEFTSQSIPFDREQQLELNYRGFKLNKLYKADFRCFDKIILELKALEMLTNQHLAQVLNYLKAIGLRLGLLVNFDQKKLEYRRIVL